MLDQGKPRSFSVMSQSNQGLTVNVLISYAKVSDKMAYANSVDPDQTAPEGAV